MRFTVGFYGFVVFGAASGVPNVARAETDGLLLTWSAPTSCPAAADVRARLVSRLPADAKVRVDGRVERRDAKHFRLKLDVETAKSHGERSLEAETCEALASSAAVVVAMSVSADREDEKASAPPPPPPPAPPPEAQPVPTRERAEPPMREPTRDRVNLRVEAAGASGLLPTAALGAGLAAGFSPTTRLRFELEGDAWLKADGYADANHTRGASFQLISGSARGCFTVVRRFGLAPCLGVDVLRLSADGFGATKKVYTSDAALWGPEGGITAAVPLVGPVSLRLGVAAFVPVERPAFVITSAGTVFRPDSVALRAYLGPEVHF